MIALALQAGLALVDPASAASSVPPNVIVVTGSRLDTDGVTARIEADEIDRLQPAALTEILDRLPGVRAASTAGIGGTSFVSVRGGDPNFTLILIDGVRVNDPSNAQGGGFDFAQLDPALVASIGLVSAGASAVHGSDALGGVISVRLRDPRDEGWSASGRLQADSLGAVQANATVALGWEGGAASVSGGGFDSAELSLGSDLRRVQLLGRAAHGFGPVEVSAFALHSATHRLALPEASGGPLVAILPDRERRDTELTVAGLTLSGDRGARIRPWATLGWTSQVADVDTPPIPPGTLQGVPAISSRTLFQRLQGTAAARTEFHPTISAVVGADYLREDARSRGTIDFGFPVPAGFDLERTQVGLFAEAEWRPHPAFTFSAAVRHDWFADAGEFTPRLGSTLVLGPSLPTLQATYFEGYKLPSLYALASPLIGNPDLRPERSRGFEVGLVQAMGPIRLRLTYFHTRYRDLIDFDVEQFISVNRQAVTVEGGEVEGSARISPAFELQGNVTYAKTDSAVPLRSRPEWQAAGRLTWRPLLDWSVELGARSNGQLLEASVPTGTIPLPGYTLLGASLSWEPCSGLVLTATVENALEEDYQEAVGFPGSGRVVRLSVSGHF